MSIQFSKLFNISHHLVKGTKASSIYSKLSVDFQVFDCKAKMNLRIFLKVFVLLSMNKLSSGYEGGGLYFQENCNCGSLKSWNEEEDMR